jgi:signal transduction histidine kinase/CheY-like chemotaxis protein/ligand-binding sensor domain-containing protein/AraC-like DNA-binding protein
MAYMKINSIFFRFFLTLLFVLSCFYGQAIKTLQKPDILELSNNAILSMHQDQHGDMWFGTYDGLNLFNGKNTFVYRYDPDNRSSITGNIIQKITDADAGYLWVSSFIGLNRFSLKDRKVVASYMQYPESRLIAVDSLGNTLLVSLSDFVSYYSPESGEFQDIFLSGINNSNVKTIFVDGHNRFQLLTEAGLLRRIVINKDHLPLTLTFEEDVVLHNSDITNAFYDDGGLYYVDVAGDLFLYDCITKEKRFITNISEIKKVKGEVSQILSWESDLYISFKNNGLVRLNTSADHAVSVVYSGVGVFCLQKDKRQNILWLGTDGQGVQMYYNKQEMFGAIMLNQLPYQVLKPIRSIYTDEYGTLWFGTKGNGLFRIRDYAQWNANSEVRERVIHYTVDDGLSDNQVFCFSESRYADIFWIGTEGPGLSYYSYDEDKIYTLNQQTIQPIRKVHSICEVNDSTLWIATAGDGLLEVTIKKNNQRFFVKNTEVYTFQRSGRDCNEFHSMIFDGDSILYIGSRGGYGVIKFNINNKKSAFLPLGNSENSAVGDILSVHLSNDSVFYFGASSGLTKMSFFSDTDEDIEQFDRNDGIANDMIHGILEDDFGCLWLSTNKGLTKYNPRNSFFHNYYSDLSVTEFSDDAYWRCLHTGRLFFGGINGLVWVEPDESLLVRYTPELRFWDLEIHGELYSLTGNPDKIVLPAQKSTFTISFIATDYIYGSNYEYSYFLEGYSSSWVELQKSNEVSFMNLPAGKYLLHVKYKNDVYDLDAIEFTIPLEILPPWYRSNLAILAYILFVFLFAGIAIRLLKRRILRQQEEVARRIKEEQKQKAYESKLNFFTNITHELFTPLTLIKGVSERLYTGIGNETEVRKHLDVLQDNVDNLDELIQEILDFRKIEEAGVLQPVIKEIDISKLVRLQSDLYLPVAQKDNIQIQLVIPDNLYWHTDKSSFKKIFANLVSNAFKYVNEGGIVRITVGIENMHLVLKVYNTGQGIEASKIPEIFNRYRVFEHMGENKYMQMTARNGLGLFICQGLVKSLAGEIDMVSEVNQYAEVIVRLPLLDGNYKPEDTSPNEVIIHDKALTPSMKPASQSEPEKPVILVVDDNRDIVWFISKTLSGIYEIKEAYSAVDALDIISKLQPALIITDIIMPHMDGLAFIQEIKKNKFTRHIPIIIVSAKTSDHEQAEGLNTGADAYLTKPFSSIVLSSTVNRLITNKKELKAYYYSPESAFEYSERQLIHKDDKEFMDKMVKVIQDNIESEHLRPELLAEELGLNTRNLYRRVKKITSLTTSDFIKDYRFTYAAQLLVSTNLSVQEIIYKVGISNKSYFYREFFKKYQMTPKQYRVQ